MVIVILLQGSSEGKVVAVKGFWKPVRVALVLVHALVATFFDGLEISPAAFVAAPERVALVIARISIAEVIAAAFVGLVAIVSV